MSLRSFFSTSGGELSPAIIIRRALFLLLLVGLMFFYLAPGFRGLTSPKGIDQAQIAREIARGNGFQTKFIRPISLYQTRSHNGDVTLVNFQDTYHAPLNPLVNSVVLNFFKNSFEWDGEENVYFLDRVIAGVSIILLLCSIGISYLLVSRIFDAKIAGVTALLMLMCELFWRFAQSGLPQMLMLFLFTFGSYFLYKAIEAQCSNRAPMLWVSLAGGFFGLLALTHWLAVWPFIGLLIFAAFYFKPRGIAAATMLGIFLIMIGIWGYRNAQVSGTPFGSGYYAIFGGMGVGEDEVMRSFDPRSENIFRRGFMSKVLITSLNQLNSLYSYFGSIVATPLFFLALLHPFKRPEIGAFRWCILAMWIFAVIGMSLFGLPSGKMDPNQLHVLFIPLLTAYGLAFLSVLWSRLGITSNVPLVTNGHLFIAVTLSVVPMVLGLIPQIQNSLYLKDRNTQAAQIALVGKYVKDTEKVKEVAVSDAPWNVAWYADRPCVWLPSNPSQLRQIQAMSEAQSRPIAGILFTLQSANAPLKDEIVRGAYADWAPIIITQTMLYSPTTRAMIRELVPKLQAGAVKDLPFTTPHGQFLQSGLFFMVDPSRVTDDE